MSGQHEAFHIHTPHTTSSRVCSKHMRQTEHTVVNSCTPWPDRLGWAPCWHSITAHTHACVTDNPLAHRSMSTDGRTLAPLVATSAITRQCWPGCWWLGVEIDPGEKKKEEKTRGGCW